MWKGHVELVKILLDNGADPNAKDPDDDSTPLHEAVDRGNVEIVKALLDKEANTYQANQDGDTPLRLMKQPLAEAIRDSHPDVFMDWWIEKSREDGTAY